MLFMDEHHPLFSPEEHPLEPGWIPFLFAVGRALGLVVLTAAGVGMVLALIGCDDYDRLQRAAEFKTRFFNGCLPRKGDTVTAQWVNGSLICKRITPTGRYGPTFPHAEVTVATIGEVEQ